MILLEVKNSLRNLDKDLVQEALDILEQYHHIRKTDKQGISILNIIGYNF